jgi:hypothetical protein
MNSGSQMDAYDPDGVSGVTDPSLGHGSVFGF